MKEVLSIIEKVCTLKARDSEVQAFFKFIESYFFKELPNACGVKNMSEVEKKMGAQFNTLTLVMFEAFLSTYCKSTNGVWNVLEVAIKRGVFSKKEEGIAKAFLNSYLGLYKVEISHGNLVLEDLVDLGEKLNIQSAPSHLLTVPKDIALALRVIHVKEGLVVTQGFLAFPIETARHHLAPLLQDLNKKLCAKEDEHNFDKLQQSIDSKKVWALEMMPYYAAFHFRASNNEENITFH